MRGQIVPLIIASLVLTRVRRRRRPRVSRFDDDKRLASPSVPAFAGIVRDDERCTLGLSLRYRRRSHRTERVERGGRFHEPKAFSLSRDVSSALGVRDRRRRRQRRRRRRHYHARTRTRHRYAARVSSLRVSARVIHAVNEIERGRWSRGD